MSHDLKEKTGQYSEKKSLPPPKIESPSRVRLITSLKIERIINLLVAFCAGRPPDCRQPSSATGKEARKQERREPPPQSINWIPQYQSNDCSYHTHGRYSYTCCINSFVINSHHLSSISLLFPGLLQTTSSNWYKYS